MNAKQIMITLLTGVVMLTAGSRTSFAAPPTETPVPPEETKPSQPAGVTEEAAALAPPLSLFINIMVDGVDNYNPAVAYNSVHDEYLVVFENDRGATRDIYAQRVAGDGTLKSWFTIVSNANKWNYLPDVAYNPIQDEYLIVYTYQINTTDYDIWARRVKWNGADLGLPAYQEFLINGDSDKQWYPSVAYNSQNDEYLVVYENYWSSTMRDIAAQRVAGASGGGTGGGQLLSWRNIATGTNQVRRLPDVAYNATRNEYFITYTYQNSATNGDIYGKITSANMGTLSSEKSICADSFDQNAVSVAAGTDEYLVVWEDGTSGSTDYDIYARRVSGDGSLPGPSGGFSIDSTGTDTRAEPNVAYGYVNEYLVTWRYVSGGGTGDDVYGRFVKPGQDAPWGNQFYIDTGPYSQRAPAVACGFFDDCLVVEEDNWPGADYEIRGRFVLINRITLPVILR
ncbi:MAG: hypothetical protein JW908_03600 [Anaerolineales bacterium]|nr:hypothetical protein [Anaerolineales bacterium]